MAGEESRAKVKRQMALLIFADALFGFAVGFASPSVAPLVVMLGVSMSFVGQAQTIGGLGTTFLPLPLGIVMDRVGRKLMMFVGGMLTVLGLFSYSLASVWFLLGVGIVLVAFDFPVRTVALVAALGDNARSGRAGYVFNINLAVTQTAATVAPILGGYVATALGFQSTSIFGIASLIAIVGVLVVFVGYDESSVQRKEPVKDVWKDVFHPSRRLLLLLIVFGLDAAAWRLSMPFWSLYIFKVMGATQEQLGLAIAIAAGTMVPANLLLSSWFSRLSRRTFVAMSEWCVLGVCGPLLLGSRVEFAYVSAAFVGLNASLWLPAVNSYIMDHFGNEKFGQTRGTIALVAGTVSAASPAIGGWLWDSVSPRAPLIATTVMVMGVGVVAWYNLREHSKTLSAVAQ